MNALEQSQIFFFISSIGFVILGVLATALLVYVIRATNTFNRIMDKLEKDIEKIGDTTKEVIDDMRDSAVFNFLFRKKRRTRKE